MNAEVVAYITHIDHAWQRKVLTRLRELVHQADPDMVEGIKWGTPAFEHNGLVVWMFCAKEWVHFSFPQGALLDAGHGLFEDTANKAQRTLKFRKGDVLPEKLIIKLVRQAVANNLADKKVDFKVPKAGERSFDVPHEYEVFLKENGLLDAYNERPYYQQKGWVQWIEEAARDETRAKRRKTMLKELRDGTYMPPKSER
ncbi:MAG TPA: DUF1801 domain-containing protein [Nevskiaceae bacterium]|nr:DUF1801 domain-containing protein [Nevskiaceae bacterium]